MPLLPPVIRLNSFFTALRNPSVANSIIIKSRYDIYFFHSSGVTVDDHSLTMWTLGKRLIIGLFYVLFSRQVVKKLNTLFNYRQNYYNFGFRFILYGFCRGHVPVSKRFKITYQSCHY